MDIITYMNGRFIEITEVYSICFNGKCNQKYTVDKKKTPKSLFGGRDHYEILEIDTEFQTFLDDFTILDLVGHIITTFRRGI